MLSDAELERYQRHIVLREVGGEGQRRLKAARVAVVGAGGLGAPLIAYLAAAGVGRLTIIDHDSVALSNLQRQILFETGDVGMPKAGVAARRVAALNPHVDVAVAPERLCDGNADRLLQSHDVVADGTDSFAARGAVNRAAVRLGIPLVAAAIGPFGGQLGVFAGHRVDAPCWACLAGEAVDRPGTSCAEMGVLGAVAGVMGAAQALEVLRLIAGFGTPMLGRLWLWDSLDSAARLVRCPKDPACPVCS